MKSSFIYPAVVFFSSLSILSLTLFLACNNTPSVPQQGTPIPAPPTAVTRSLITAVPTASIPTTTTRYQDITFEQIPLASDLDIVYQNPPVEYDWGWQNPLPQGNGLNAVWGTSSSDVFAVGGFGTIMHYDGESWSVMTSGKFCTLYDVWGSSADDVYAVGSWSEKGVTKSTILHYNGRQWSTVINWEGHIYRIWGSSASDIFVVGDDILHYDGNAWSRMTVGGRLPLIRDIWGTSPTDVYAVGSTFGFLHYDGDSCSTMPTSGYINNINHRLDTVWGTSTSDVFAGGGIRPAL
jgi:hypothetical protein